MKTTIQIFITVIVTCCLLSSCDFFLSGSYPYAEQYKFDTSHDKLVSQIKRFKRKHPEFNVFSRNQNDSLYNIDRDTDGFYGFYFKVPMEDSATVVMMCVINKSANNNYPATLLFNSITLSEKLSGWQRINKDLSRKDNKKFKALFERTVLDSLGMSRH